MPQQRRQCSVIPKKTRKEFNATQRNATQRNERRCLLATELFCVPLRVSFLLRPCSASVWGHPSRHTGVRVSYSRKISNPEQDHVAHVMPHSTHDFVYLVGGGIGQQSKQRHPCNASPTWVQPSKSVDHSNMSVQFHQAKGRPVQSIPVGWDVSYRYFGVGRERSDSASTNNHEQNSTSMNNIRHNPEYNHILSFDILIIYYMPQE